MIKKELFTTNTNILIINYLVSIKINHNAILQFKLLYIFLRIDYLHSILILIFFIKE